MDVSVTGPADLDGVLAMEAANDTAQWLGTTGRHWHLAALADPDQEHLTARVENRPIGFATLAGLTTANDEIEIRRMVIDAPYRGRGHGRDLLRALMARATADHKAAIVWLDVKRHNTLAQHLYETEGFIAERNVARAVQETDGRAPDLVIMKRHRSLPDGTSQY